MKRVAYLDGLRGFAALLVVVMHYVLAFAPAIGNINPALAHPVWENLFIHSPLFFLADGYVAVSIFFLISGTVLTYSFEASERSFATQVTRRLIRLGVPAGASVVLGAVWFFAFPNAHVAAASLLFNNAWLAATGPSPPRMSAVLNELVTTLVFGHAHFSLLFPGTLGDRIGLLPLSQSFNAPLWTLHLEFYGSLLILLLVASEQNLSPRLHRLVCVIAVCGLIAHPLGLFSIGYLAGKMLKTTAWARIAARNSFRILGCVAVLVGISMSAHVAPNRFMALYLGLVRFEELPMKADDFHFFSQYGAILIFFGILAVPGFQRGLSSGLGRMLGKYSFSLYLVHFPILLTLTSFLTVRFAAMGVGTAFSVASVIGLSITVLLTAAFERYVDRPATELSRRVRLLEAHPQAKKQPGNTPPGRLPATLTKENLGEG